MSEITANKDSLRQQVENSIGIATALNPYIGYVAATDVAISLPIRQAYHGQGRAAVDPKRTIGSDRFPTLCQSGFWRHKLDLWSP